MGTLHRIAAWLGLTRDAVDVDGIMPPTRAAVAPITDRQAVVMPAVFRALSILTTAAGQLTVDVRRGVTPVDRVPSVIRRPSDALRFDEWVTQLVLDLAVNGNAFVRRVRVDREVLDLPILPASEVMVGRDPVTGATVYRHGGREYRADEVDHLSLIRRAGWLRGISPIEAARKGLTFTAGSSDYAAEWWTGSGQPTGVLSSEQNLTADQAKQYRDVWNSNNRKDNPSGVKVLGKGLAYEPILLKPSDVLWLEAQEATTTDIARIFGIPATLMLVGIEGGATTYANVSQEWLGFVRFTLMGYLRPIEQLLTDVLPRGSDARFNLDGLVRPDTRSRYEAHAIALENKWLTIEEVRAIEGLGPLPIPASQEVTSHATQDQ